MPDQTKFPITRRLFLKKSAKAGLAGLAMPTIVPATVFSKNSPSNRIVLGFIGLGGMGTGNLRGFLHKEDVLVVAVCDVDLKHREEARNSVNRFYRNNDCAAYNDFRDITRREDIDAVVISTPDHWHVLPAIDAAKHNKDMYVEKPLTLTIREGRALCDVVNRYGRILQTGSQQRSDASFRYACELVRNGRIGNVQTVEVTIPENNRDCGPVWSPEPVPEGFDYDFWLGPAPWAPYTKDRTHYTFRFQLDYSGGQVTNWGAHYLDIAQWGLGMDDTGPVEITGRGEFPKTGLFTTATYVDFDCLYANGTRLTCKTGGQGTKFIGADGWIFVNRDVLETHPASLIKETIQPNEIHLQRSSDHQQNFLDCIRSRQKTIAHEEIGHRSASLCHLGNIAMLLKTPLTWNPQGEEFIGNASANAMLGRPRRSLWSL